MTVTVYSYLDSGAPVLQNDTGVGGIIRILDACLVDGYGSKAAAGWSKAYSGANKAAYRLPAAATVRGYLRVDDSQAAYATVHGYETMSDVDTGTARFPSTGTDYYWLKVKTDTAVSGGYQWWVIADELFVYVIVGYYGVHPSKLALYAFGEYVSAQAEDVSPLLLLAYTTSTVSDAVGYHDFTGGLMSPCGVGVPNYTAGQILSRTMDGMGVGVAYTNQTFGGDGNRLGGSPYIPGPDAAFGGVLMAPVYVAELLTSTTTSIRGTWPGRWNPLHLRDSGAANASVSSDVVGLPGRDMMAMQLNNHGVSGDYRLQYFDVTGPWR